MSMVHHFGLQKPDRKLLNEEKVCKFCKLSQQGDKGTVYLKLKPTDFKYQKISSAAQHKKFLIMFESHTNVQLSMQFPKGSTTLWQGIIKVLMHIKKRRSSIFRGGVMCGNSQIHILLMSLDSFISTLYFQRHFLKWFNQLQKHWERSCLPRCAEKTESSNSDE